MKTILVMLDQKLSTKQTQNLNDSFKQLRLKPTYEFKLTTLTEWSKDSELKNSTKCFLVDCEAKNHYMKRLLETQKECVFFYILPGKQDEKKIEGGNYGFVRPTFDSMLDLFENIAATHPEVASNILKKEAIGSEEKHEELDEDIEGNNSNAVVKEKYEESRVTSDDVVINLHSKGDENFKKSTIDNNSNQRRKIKRNIKSPKQSYLIKEIDEDNEENSYHKLTKNIQKQLFTKQKWDDTRMIGVWSPLNRVGVTTFVLNFAFHLAENRIQTAVLEGLTENHVLKSWLTRYTQVVPKNWKSFANVIWEGGNPLDMEWRYRNVLFLPLDTKDHEYEWVADLVEPYMSTTKIVDVTLVDLPTGKMENITKESLKYLDELWIVIDDSFLDIIAWKDHLQSLKNELNIPMYLIMNKTFGFSKQERISKELDITLLASLPAMQEDVMRNYYETTPLYFMDTVHEELVDKFKPLTKHLLGKSFEISKTHDKQKSWISKLLKPLN